MPPEKNHEFTPTFGTEVINENIKSEYALIL